MVATKTITTSINTLKKLRDDIINERCKRVDNKVSGLVMKEVNEEINNLLEDLHNIKQAKEFSGWSKLCKALSDIENEDRIIKI